jgi:hypothetical protein
MDGWWLTLSYDEAIAVTTPKDAPIIGIDVGIANFTTSEGKRYGTFHSQGHQSPSGPAPPGVDAEATPVGRSPTARPVGASTEVGKRVKYLMIFCPTMGPIG